MLTKPPLTLLALLLLAGVVTGISLLLLRDGMLSDEARIDALPPELALRFLDAQGDSVPLELTFRHARLAAEAGRAKEAEEMLARLADTPATRDARAALAERHSDVAGALWLLSGEGAPALDHPPRARSLARLASLSGNPSLEVRALSSVPAAILQPQEALRLADLLAARGAWDDLVQLTQERLAAGGADRAEMLRRLAIVSVTQDRSAALIEVLEDLRQSPSFETDLQSIAPVLSQRPALASEAADRLTNRYRALRPAITTALARGGAFSAARRLALELAGELPDPEAWRALTAYADASGDLPPLQHALLRVADPPAQAFLPLVRHRGPTALLSYGERLDRIDLSQTPLLRAAWATALGRPDEATVALQQAAPQAAAEAPENAPIWRVIYAELGTDPAALRLAAKVSAAPATAWLVME